MSYKNPSRGLKGFALILAAGLGTRLKPWTDKHPKALAVVNNKTLLQRNIEYLQQFGIINVVVNVHHFADQIIDAIEKNNGWGSNITISDETNEVLETGGGLMKAAPLLHSNNPFVLMNVDILTDLDLGKMIDYHKKHSPLATLATSSRSTSRYLLFNEKNKMAGWRNTNTGEEKIAAGVIPGSLHPKAFSGLHVISPGIFSQIKQQGKFSMIDVYLDLMNDHSILSFEQEGSKFIDVGKPESIEKAETLFN